MPRLVIKNDGEQVQSWELQVGVNRFGRSEGNDFSIDHPTISSAHCEVVPEGDGVIVRDLGSTNGTFIEGKRINEGRLEFGQTLQMGDVKMVLEPTPVSIAIPQVSFAKEPEPMVLADGSLSCENHPTVRATERCTKCGHVFCETCTHHLRRVGGKFLNLCPLCSAQCEVIPGELKPEKRTLWSRLRQTLKISSKR